MKYYITHFYNLRFFKPYMIPVSTAITDQAFFHKSTYNNNYFFIDNNGVMNGIREECLSPKFLPQEACKCSKNCSYQNLNPECPFLLAYEQYLDTLDFNTLLSNLEQAAIEVQQVLNFKEEPCIVLLVHEAENNPCSERKSLQKYFRKHGIELENWSRELCGQIF